MMIKPAYTSQSVQHLSTVELVYKRRECENTNLWITVGCVDAWGKGGGGEADY